MMRLSRIALLAAALAALQGCASTSNNIRGKVIAGERSFIGVVESTDPRLNGQGLSGAEIQVVSSSGPASGATIARGASDAKGDFVLPVEHQQALIHPAQFRAARPGHQDASQTMSVPPSDRRVLIILRPTGGAGAQ